ncbi:DUF4390 domain-containing protein [Thermodesulfobacteriota bacterium]
MRFPISILIAGLICIPAAPVCGQEARLTNIIVTNTRDDLLLYLAVEGCFTAEMKQAVLNGVPTTFLFHVSLSRVRNFWPDRTLVRLTAAHTVKYDNLKNTFTVARSWAPESPVVTESFAEAQKTMAEVDSLVVAPLSSLEKGKPYEIRAKAELDKVTLPFYLHYVFFFLSLWDFETDWHTIEFHY